jgi:hypothetical protein
MSFVFNNFICILESAFSITEKKQERKKRKSKGRDGEKRQSKGKGRRRKEIGLLAFV